MYFNLLNLSRCLALFLRLPIGREPCPYVVHHVLFYTLNFIFIVDKKCMFTHKVGVTN